MGADIHMYLEKKVMVDGKETWVNADLYKKNKWYDGINKFEHQFIVQPFYWGRNYILFGILAGVRNMQNIMICEPKGWPDDITPEVKDFFKEMEEDAHSYSYLTINEISDFLRTVPITRESNDPNDNPLKVLFERLVSRYNEEDWGSFEHGDENGDKFRTVFWFDN